MNKSTLVGVEKTKKQAGAELGQDQQSWDWGGINWLVAGYIGKESRKNILYDTGLKFNAWTESWEVFRSTH